VSSEYDEDSERSQGSDALENDNLNLYGFTDDLETDDRHILVNPQENQVY